MVGMIGIICMMVATPPSPSPECRVYSRPFNGTLAECREDLPYWYDRFGEAARQIEANSPSLTLLSYDLVCEAQPT